MRKNSKLSQINKDEILEELDQGYGRKEHTIFTKKIYSVFIKFGDDGI